jgi:hypothetical protein
MAAARPHRPEAAPPKTRAAAAIWPLVTA